MAIDPRRRFPFGQMAPMMYGAGTLNNAAPMFQGPAYYNQMFNRPLQDWSQFMPTNSPLAGGGGALYQTPWGYGTGGGSGWGGAFGGGGGMMGGGLMGGGYPGWGGGYPGWTQPGFPSGSYTSPGFIPRPDPTFVPGGQDYFPTMTPWPTDPSLPGPIPGSDKASDLAAGRTHHPEMYDQNDMWVGAEGAEVDPADPSTWGADVFGIRDRMNVAADDAWGNQVTTPYAPTVTGPMGLLASQVFDDDPVAFATGTGLIGPDEGTINQFNTPSYGTGDPDLNVNAVPAVSTWSQPSMTPTTTTPAYSTQGDVPTRNVIPNVNVPNTGPPGLAAQQAAAAQAQAQAQQQAYDQNVAVQAQQAQAAQQQRYLASLDDESARQMMNMSQAQQEREAAQVEAAAMSRASGASAAQSSRMAAARSRAASRGGNGGGGGGGGNGGNGDRGWGGGRE